MDPAPRDWAELPRDPQLGVTVPFACGTADAAGVASAVELDGRRVTQCALSRVCGVCGAGLGRPIAFVGPQREVERNAFHFPPAHVECAHRLVQEYAGAGLADRAELGVLGQSEPVPDWRIVLTAGFEFVRPGREQEDRRPVFTPNSVLAHEPVG
jgi:hypothetical protein